MLLAGKGVLIAPEAVALSDGSAALDGRGALLLTGDALPAGAAVESVAKTTAKITALENLMVVISNR